MTRWVLSRPEVLNPSLERAHSSSWNRQCSNISWGTYPLARIGQTLVIEVDQGRLWNAPPNRPRMELKALGPTRFYVEELKADIEFTPQRDGGIAVRITQPGGDTLGYRVATLSPRELAQYAGTYWSEELEAQYTIAVHDRGLVALNAHHGEIKLVQYTQDRFVSNAFFFHEVHFIRGEPGKVTGLTVGGGRVTEVDFVRK